MFLFSAFSGEVFGHGGNGVDRAPEIDFENRKVTIIGKMSPSDMTVGDFSNAFMEIKFVEVFEIKSDKRVDDLRCVEDLEDFTCTYDTPIRQTTFAVDVLKDEKLLARNNFYAEEGIMTIDVRPDNNCSAEQEEPWKCTTYYGSEHPLAVNALYAYGQNNPVIDGPLFTEGGLYHIQVQVIGAESPRSNFKDSLPFDLYVSIAQEQTFWLDLESGQIFHNPKHLR